jgi:hypothetical protein
MITSYLDIPDVSKLVFYNDVPHLLDLIRFSLSTLFGLQIDDFHNPLFPENVMTTFDTQLESKPFEQTDQFIKADVLIGCAAQNLI